MNDTKYNCYRVFETISIRGSTVDPVRNVQCSIAAQSDQVIARDGGRNGRVGQQSQLWQHGHGFKDQREALQHSSEGVGLDIVPNSLHDRREDNGYYGAPAGNPPFAFALPRARVFPEHEVDDVEGAENIEDFEEEEVVRARRCGDEEIDIACKEDNAVQ